MSRAADRRALRAVQRWFAGVVMHAPGVRAALRRRGGTAPRAAVMQKPSFGTTTARLQVYGEAYFARLVEVVAGDYPALRAAVGERRFAAWARRYLVRCPSRHPNLNQLGARFPRHVRTVERADDVAAGLARIELAVTKAFDAPAHEPLPASALADVPPSRWQRMRIEVHPSVQLLRVPAAAADRYLAWGTGGSSPRRAGHVHLCVLRVGEEVQRCELPAAAAKVLRRLQRGERLGRALAAAPADAPVDAWFARWRADGVFVELR